MKAMWSHIASMVLVMCIVFGVCVTPSFALTPPLDGGYVVNQRFWNLRSTYHLGDDLAADVGDSVRSICEGVVVEVVFHDNAGNYGGRVLIQCDTEEGTVVVLYGHLGRPTSNPATNDIFVQVGNAVAEGQIIGRIGDRSENGGFVPHLHLAISKGAYQGAAIECERWRYAGYTRRSYTTSDPCFCAVLDNWYDPSEFLGIRPRSLRITSTGASPSAGQVNSTSFVWTMEGQGGRGAAIRGTVFIWNPVQHREYEFPMMAASGVGRFEHVARLQNTGLYAYRFRIETCAESVEEDELRSGPVVQGESPSCIAHAEECDGQDNDCDGVIDDGVSTQNCTSACGAGVQTCSAGRWSSCSASQPQSEVCDAIDNDCDGSIDENLSRGCTSACGSGMQICRSGTWAWCSAPLPQPEVCNGVDEDCDGVADNNLPSLPCTNSCGNTGTESCVNGVVQCSAAPCQPPPPPPPPPPTCSTEVCDGVDNDCDNQVDENVTRPCSNSCGNSGTENCIGAGSWGSCSAAPCNPNPPPSPTPTPPPTQLPAPTLRGPSDGYIDRAPIGLTASAILRWNGLSGVSNYEYQISTANGSGPVSLVEQNFESGTAHTFARGSAEYGQRFSWRVRAIDANGNPGAWSVSRSFFFSHVTGDTLVCSNSACPSQGAWYEVSTSISPGGNGQPDRLILDWVSATCTAGRSPQNVNFINIQNYARSSRFNGCPP